MQKVQAVSTRVTKYENSRPRACHVKWSKFLVYVAWKQKYLGSNRAQELVFNVCKLNSFTTVLRKNAVSEW